jgi:hypothetical protein
MEERGKKLKVNEWGQKQNKNAKKNRGMDEARRKKKRNGNNCKRERKKLQVHNAKTERLFAALLCYDEGPSNWANRAKVGFQIVKKRKMRTGKKKKTHCTEEHLSPS